MRMEPVPGAPLSANPTVTTFLSDPQQLSDLFPYDWTQQASYERRAAYLKQGGYRGNRTALAAALKRYNEALGASPESLANIRQLEEGALAVVTGQQPGVLTGPAYSVYKAVTAILLARQQSERLGTAVVPVYWIPGEDHDWLEIASVLIPQGDSMTRLSLTEDLNGDRRSVGLAPAPESVAAVVSQFADAMPETEFKEAILERIREAVTGSPALPAELTGHKPSMADQFGRLMAWLFAGTGLIFLNASDPALRRLEAEFFTEVIDRHEQLDAALGQGYERLMAKGLAATVDRQVGNLNLFTYVGGERLPLVGAGDHFWVRDREELAWSKEELTARAQATPDLFSTNVVLRPVVQGRLLPDLAYIGGPGEISYFALYKDVFATLGQEMPVVYPRLSFTLVEPPVARILEKQELSISDVFFRLDEKRQELLEREDRLGITDLFERFRSDFEGLYSPLVDTVLQLDPNLKFVTEENRKQIAVQVNKLEEKAKQQHRKNCEVALRQFDRLRSQLYPGGGLQERTVSVLPYLVKYGPDLVEQLLAQAVLEGPWQHRAVYLGS